MLSFWQTPEPLGVLHILPPEVGGGVELPEGGGGVELPEGGGGVELPEGGGGVELPEGGGGVEPPGPRPMSMGKQSPGSG